MFTMNEESIRDALKSVIDPELAVNVVDLGMVRYIRCLDGAEVSVGLSLTSVACPLWELFEDQVQLALKPLGLTASVEFIAHPPWTPVLMNPATRDELVATGMLSPARFANIPLP